MGKLTKNERAALREIEFELGKPHTLKKIAKFLKCSEVYVFEIEKRALGKMRKMLAEQGKEDWQGGLRDLDEDSELP